MPNIGNISLKTRLLLIIGAVFLFSLTGEGLLRVYNWKQAIRSEVDASFSLAERLAGNNLPGAGARLSSEAGESIIDALQGLRHINIIVKPDHSGRFADKAEAVKEAGVPDWFAGFLYPDAGPLPSLTLAGPNRFSSIVIEADPSAEIIARWEDFRIRTTAAFVFLFFVILLTYIGLYIGFRPLNDVLAAFRKLEAGSFDHKLSEQAAPELSRINRKFNHLLMLLRRAAEDNALLARKMLNLQEEERRALARELHDEMAPHLFGIRATAARINALLDDNEIQQAGNELAAIDNRVSELQQQMRALLGRLRPLVLDDLSIKEALGALIESREVRGLPLKWELDLTELDEEYLSDTIKVTLYRIVQEGISNIIRHAEAENVKIWVSSQGADTVAMQTGSDARPDKKRLHILIEDDGKGIPAGASHGFGLIGMRERVEVLSGRFLLSAPPKGGLRITADIPLS